MNEYEYDNGCLHKWVSVNKRYSTGKNMIGVEVTALVEDIKCEVCETESLMVLEADPIYYKNI